MRRAAIVALVVMAGALTAAPEARAGDPIACRVSNKVEGTSGDRLRPMVEAAADGDLLVIRGRCWASLDITADITLVGARGGSGVIVGPGARRVIHVVPGADVSMSRIVIRGGHAETGGGGGIWNEGTLTLTDVVVRGNRAGPMDPCGEAPDPTCAWKRSGQDAGGGILNDGTMRLVHSRVRGNVAGQGGGMTNRGEATVLRSIISGNEAGEWGESQGGGIANTGDMHILRSAVVRNRIVSGEGYTAGAGIFNGGTLRVEDTTISRNEAFGNNGEIGGGIANGFEYGGSPGRLELVSSTVVRNRGGGLYTCPDGACYADGSTRVGSSIIARNPVIDRWEGSRTDVDCWGPVTSLGHNLIGAKSARSCRGLVDGEAHDRVGTLRYPVDPRLGPLARNGGDTLTHALLDGSPALDGAGGAPCATGRDQRGIRRPGGARCDIGAYERR